MPIETLVWVLPRPRRDKFKGGFPLHFEKKLLRLYGYDVSKDLKDKVLHPFGGKAEYGFRVDIDPSTKPDLLGDAHNLPSEWTNKWEMVILDPPYTAAHSKKLYQTGKINYHKYIEEAVRVCKTEGYIVVYHWVVTPRPKNTKFDRRIVILTRVWHRPRVACIFKKEGG
jgi:tRNA G10  N-methylase Trm11